jgi:6-pyruvoyl-tetrahydropterin synthase
MSHRYNYSPDDGHIVARNTYRKEINIKSNRRESDGFKKKYSVDYELEMAFDLNELKDAIRQEVLTIDQQLLARALDDFKRRIENCIQEDGRHLNDIIFHTGIPNSNGMS